MYVSDVTFHVAMGGSSGSGHVISVWRKHFVYVGSSLKYDSYNFFIATFVSIAWFMWLRNRLKWNSFLFKIFIYFVGEKLILYTMSMAYCWTHSLSVPLLYFIVTYLISLSNANSRGQFKLVLQYVKCTEARWCHCEYIFFLPPILNYLADAT